MTLQEDMESKRNWTQDEINALKAKHRRTHFTHFSGVELKPRRYKTIRGRLYAWHLGAWRRVEDGGRHGKGKSKDV